MNRRKPENDGLPKRWRLHHGKYYYRVPPGSEHLWEGKKNYLLGSTLPEAYRAWADRVDAVEQMTTVRAIFERYLLEVVPTKSPKTQTENVRQIRTLTEVFGSLPPADIRPQMVYQYVDKRSAKTAAHREIEVLSHALTKAVEWGVIDRHPFKGEVRLKGEKPRDRYVEDWEVIEALKLPSRRKRGSVEMIQAYIRLKLLTGLARSDLLRLMLTEHVREDGIHVQRHKTMHTTGKRTIYEWTPELRQAISEAKASRPVDISPFLFCNGSGQGYFDESKGTANGWDSMWGRFMDRVLSETQVEQRFTEHDLRAKCASDAETLEQARALLQHADGRTTARVYRRKAERVKPGRGI